MPDPKRKYWWCGGKTGAGHIVGELGHIDMQIAGRVKVLLLYEESVDAPAEEVPPLRERLVTGFEVHCTKCANQFDWYPSLESLNKLLKHYEKVV
jgi:hypothetical protein